MPGVDLPSVIIATLANDGRVLRISGCEELLGLAAESVIGRSAEVLVLPIDTATAKAGFAMLLAGEDVRDLELRCRHSDGRELFITLFGRRKSPGTIRIAAFDTTAQHRQRRRLRQQKLQAEAAKRAKSNILAHIGHEIRTPMNGILGIVDLLGDSDLDSPQQKLIETLRSSTHSLIALLNDLLDLSRAEAGKLVVIDEAVDLRELATDVYELFVPTATSKQIEFVHNVAAAVPKAVRLDPLRLRQVLVNLLGNALKFTDTGFVRLEIHCEPLDSVHIRLRFDVHDSGIGIAATNLDRIFEEYEQGEIRRYGGSGLGLAICRQIATVMGGTLVAKSELGRGSIFSYILDTTIVAADEKEPPPPQPQPTTRPLRILIAEDNEVNALVVRTMLEKLGHHPTRVENGALALEALECQHFDAVLMDCNMPVMDGFAAATAIRSDPRWQDLPLIALTASSMPEDTLRCPSVGMDRILLKPIDQVSLAAILATVDLTDKDNAETGKPQMHSKKEMDSHS
ncbi:MAG TPA: PAS domain-containing hybrid sensor histidine kinase/response regulator [Nannocystis exedens]|nr:PAS domain-containing hybrid sensor histidine kinase/response regulator [Nannocystis exedens]